MLNKSLLAISMIGGMLILSPSTRGQSEDPAKELPEGKGKDLVASTCQQCHGLGLITDSHRSLSEWKDTIGNMISNGASLEPDEVDIVAQYLAKNFGPATNEKESKKNSEDSKKE